jgi:hypothetical protein
MKCWSIALPLVGLGFLASLAGCTVREVYVREPPPERIEVIPARPSAVHVWIRGRWERLGDRWEWIPGRWERRG